MEDIDPFSLVSKKIPAMPIDYGFLIYENPTP